MVENQQKSDAEPIGIRARWSPRRGCILEWDWDVESFETMLKVKDTLRSTVRLSFDGRVEKVFHGSDAAERFDNEVRVLRHLERVGCGFVPRLLEEDRERLRIITSNCGSRVDRLDDTRTAEVFAELEPFGVRHDDANLRNVTYRMRDGRFCLIDFELATLLPGHESIATQA